LRFGQKDRILEVVKPFHGHEGYEEVEAERQIAKIRDCPSAIVALLEPFSLPSPSLLVDAVDWFERWTS